MNRLPIRNLSIIGLQIRIGQKWESARAIGIIPYSMSLAVIVLAVLRTSIGKMIVFHTLLVKVLLSVILGQCLLV